jgi:hypothetical protein
MRRLDSSTAFWFFLSQEGFLPFAFRSGSLLDGGFISGFYPHSEGVVLDSVPVGVR